MFPARCLLPQLDHFLLQECVFPALLLVNELFVFTNHTIHISYGASGFNFLSCLIDNSVVILGLIDARCSPPEGKQKADFLFFAP